MQGIWTPTPFFHCSLSSAIPPMIWILTLHGFRWTPIPHCVVHFWQSLEHVKLNMMFLLALSEYFQSLHNVSTTIPSVYNSIPYIVHSISMCLIKRWVPTVISSASSLFSTEAQEYERYISDSTRHWGTNKQLYQSKNPQRKYRQKSSHNNSYRVVNSDRVLNRRLGTEYSTVYVQERPHTGVRSVRGEKTRCWEERGRMWGPAGRWRDRQSSVERNSWLVSGLVQTQSTCGCGESWPRSVSLISNEPELMMVVI